MELFVYKGISNLPSIDFDCLRTIVSRTHFLLIDFKYNENEKNVIYFILFYS